MSHFTVMVRITQQSIEKHGSPREALNALLAPYQENNMGDCPEQYLQFFDHTEEVKDGYDELDEKERAQYKSLADYAKEYHGYGPSKEDDLKFGYYENPNKRWDWWQLGGRWTGYFRLKSGAERVVGSPGVFGGEAEACRGDMVRLSDIDMDAVAAASRARADKFWDEWQRFLAGEKFRAFEGPRSRALDIGLLEIRREGLRPGEESRAIPWRGEVPEGDSRADWFDVYKLIDHAEFDRDYAQFFNELQTYAFMDERGWVQPGQMGWFACTDATPESRGDYVRAFSEWIKETPADALLAVVDCHI